ncbi:putative seryl-tRNA synthetase [Dunaliella salina]|uniref:serine--tRNA ligase n=1 Tax=Dunaliella salina TaxID=3046 RepID=A0ABQ7GXM2_DUNSA|nr:putative seryl-tRNA synthetase [Dunaliella salina]|eukprot:KAF5839363.1 putative seryl-tRNA synthetase [Dunaliella salina]
MLLNPSLSQRYACLQHHYSRPLPCPRRQQLQRGAHASSTDPATAPASAVTLHQHAPSFKAAIDFKSIKADLEAVERNCKVRNSRANPRRAVELYEEYVRVKLEADTLRADRNNNSSRMKGKLEKEERDKLIAAGQQLKEALGKAEEQVALVEQAMQVEGQRIPNSTHPEVPLGGEENATLLASVGEQRVFEGFQPADHVKLAESLKMVDFDAAAEVTGQKFYYLCNAGALLELALVSWAMARVGAKGYTPFTTPDIVKASVLEKCGFQPRGTNTQVYSIEDSPLCLTGTAEVPLAGLYMDKVLQESELPIRMAAFGHCFRTEAGAAGAAGKGLFRVHQFSKVEMFILCAPSQSDALHEELRVIGQEMYTDLGLHFKVLDMPSEDLGASAHRKFDMEAWMPGLNRYGEISSASNCTDYQVMECRICMTCLDVQSEEGASQGKKQKGGKKGSGGGGAGARTEFVHTLNSTACAVPRIIVAILENFQQADGSVIVPQQLRPFLGGMEVIRAPQSLK